MVDKCLKMKKDKRFCPVSTLSEAGKTICCSSKKVYRSMLLSHFLVNQIAGKPVHLSYHIIMCWYELMVQFVGPALACISGPVVGALGCYVCASRLQVHDLKNQGSIYFGIRELLSKDLSFPPPKKKRKKLGSISKIVFLL